MSSDQPDIDVRDDLFIAKGMAVFVASLDT